jgi:pyruvate/2-oxoacid:ferredoxin oxidoreductase beta subunit
MRRTAGKSSPCFFVNNAIYGMTGGQMAPTTPVGQRSTTSPWGRRPSNEGFPLHMAELLATLETPMYIERVALLDNKTLIKVRRKVRQALELQRDHAEFSFVEILSPCPAIWNMTPQDARKWIEENMLPVFPLGVLRDRKVESTENAVPQTTVTLAMNEPSLHKFAKQVARRRRRSACQAQKSRTGWEPPT